MPRVSEESKKIAYRILGTPPNLRKQEKGKRKKKNEKLVRKEIEIVR